MGNIAVDVFKNINFNKVVDKEIIKNVDVNVDIDNPLAESEADAEAFGPNPLAQTDTFAYVNAERDGIIEFPSDGQVDALGNASIELTNDANGNGLVDTGDTITITYLDVDDINGIEHWLELSSPPPGTPDADLPVPGVFVPSDKVLLIGEESTEFPGEFEATLQGDHTIDFGIRTLPSYELYGGPHNFDITVPGGSQYLVEVNNELGEIEVEYDIRPIVAQPAVLINFGPNNVDVETEFYTQEAAQIGALGEWNFDVRGTLLGARPGLGEQEAFAYSESTAALDLDQVIPIPEPETVV
ncbi:MAG: hypothetical protein AB4372_15805 [Xenococcus sp. (in: cyanobacteria)]